MFKTPNFQNSTAGDDIKTKLAALPYRSPHDTISAHVTHSNPTSCKILFDRQEVLVRIEEDRVVQMGIKQLESFEVNCNDTTQTAPTSPTKPIAEQTNTPPTTASADPTSDLAPELDTESSQTITPAPITLQKTVSFSIEPVQTHSYSEFVSRCEEIKEAKREEERSLPIFERLKVNVRRLFSC